MYLEKVVWRTGLPPKLAAAPHSGNARPASLTLRRAPAPELPSLLHRADDQPDRHVDAAARAGLAGAAVDGLGPLGGPRGRPWLPADPGLLASGGRLRGPGEQAAGGGGMPGAASRGGGGRPPSPP